MALNWAEHAAMLNELHQLARDKQVGYSIVYEESADTFYVTINSVAIGESTVTKSYGFIQHALDDAIKHLKTI